MNRAATTLGLALALTLGAGCLPILEKNFDDNPCGEARQLLNACGVSLSYLYGDYCGGPRLLIAECVVEQGATCDELANIDFESCLNTEQREQEYNDYVLAPDPSVAVPRWDLVPVEPGPEDNDNACSDGEDNDDDGFVDCLDVDCSHGPTITVCPMGGT